MGDWCEVGEVERLACGVFFYFPQAGILVFWGVLTECGRHFSVILRVYGFAHKDSQVVGLLVFFLSARSFNECSLQLYFLETHFSLCRCCFVGDFFVLLLADVVV